MENRPLLKQLGIIAGIIVLAVISRLMPHPANMTPLAALGLFSGAYFTKKQAAGIIMVSMLLSDLFLGFHNTMVFVYGSLLLTVLLGSFLKNKLQALSLVSVSILSSILFFVVTNFGVWLMSGMYPHTGGGLMNAYVMGIPFFKNTLLGDIIFSFMFFYGFAFLEKFYYKFELKHS